MKILKNQAGLSIVQAMVAMALVAAAGVAYMGHVRNNARNEARQKVKNKITLMELEVIDQLKNKDFCNENFYHAFKATPIAGVAVQGDPTKTYAVMKKYNRDSDGIIRSFEETFKVGNFYDKKTGSIWISDIQYDLSEVATAKSLGLDSPFEKMGKLKITFALEHCNSGGKVRNIESPYTETCNGTIIRTDKVFHKQVAFSLDPATQLLKTQDLEVYDPTTQNIKVHDPNPIDPLDQYAGGTLVIRPPSPSVKYTQTPVLACGDSQDAILKESNEYTDKRICLAQAEALMAAGKAGKNKCGQTVVRRKVVYDVDIGSPVKFKFPDEETVKTSDTEDIKLQILTETLKVYLVGGGGGGNGGGSLTVTSPIHPGPSNQCGVGGEAGKQEMNGNNLSLDMLKSAICQLQVGKGGVGGDTRFENSGLQGEAGEASTVSCKLKDGTEFNLASERAIKWKNSSMIVCADVLNDTQIMIDGTNSLYGFRGHGGKGGAYRASGEKGGDGVVRITWFQMMLIEKNAPASELNIEEYLHEDGKCDARDPSCYFLP